MNKNKVYHGKLSGYQIRMIIYALNQMEYKKTEAKLCKKVLINQLENDFE